MLEIKEAAVSGFLAKTQTATTRHFEGIHNNKDIRKSGSNVGSNSGGDSGDKYDNSVDNTHSCNNQANKCKPHHHGDDGMPLQLEQIRASALIKRALSWSFSLIPL